MLQKRDIYIEMTCSTIKRVEMTSLGKWHVRVVEHAMGDIETYISWTSYLYLAR